MKPGDVERLLRAVHELDVKELALRLARDRASCFTWPQAVQFAADPFAGTDQQWSHLAGCPRCRYLVRTVRHPASAAPFQNEGQGLAARMPAREPAIVDNEAADRQILALLRNWCRTSAGLDVASDFLEIGALLGLQDQWQQVDTLRILMGADTPLRHQTAFADAQQRILVRLDDSLEREKEKNDFLVGVPSVAEALRSGKINCRLYRKDKLQARAFITHARAGGEPSALVGATSLSLGGLTDKTELNVQLSGAPVVRLQDWYQDHWKDAADITPAILQTIERHTRPYPPFEIYAKALQEFFKGHEMTAGEWELAGPEHGGSRMYPELAQYQKEGYQALMKIARQYNGAFLCDGVGLGKTFVGLMLIERLVVHDRKRVALFVPKVARESVWDHAIRENLSHIRSRAFSSNFIVFNHTDLQRGGEFPHLLQDVKDNADVIVIDEAHHFRNPGIKGEGEGKPSRYWRLFDLIRGPRGVKQVFMLTATPVNNRLIDLQHMIELFTQREQGYFKNTLGIHSLPGHFRKMEKELEKTVQQRGEGDIDVETNLAEAEDMLAGDTLFRALVVQRSRAYVKQSQVQQNGAVVLFPDREDPRVAEYSVKKTYGRLLQMVEQAFSKEKPLFSLAIYAPLAYRKGDDKGAGSAKEKHEREFAEGRQKQVVGLIRTQFLKRFESSAHAFACSCDRLLLKLLAFVQAHSETDSEKDRLDRWLRRHADITGYVREHQRELFGDDVDEADEDLIPEEMLDEVQVLSRADYAVEEMLAETYSDLDQIVEFLKELRKFQPKHDDKLKALFKLLKSDPVVSKHKVLLFTEFADTAHYLRDQLRGQGIDGIDEVDSTTHGSRDEIIRRFAPYYNGSSSSELQAKGQKETHILISTDVLSEGLNLQDATRLINYDLHWNPVRLMQRIGRVDRRMNPAVEARIAADHPEQTALRGKVAYWNFLPPDELNELLTLYKRVTHKTLRISKTFGIEGRKLLRPEDDYEALRNFNHIYEGTTTPVEAMHLEYQDLLRVHPDLAQRLADLPGRVFSGKPHPEDGKQGIFFCYALPAAERGSNGQAGSVGAWTEEAGRTAWYLFDTDNDEILEDAAQLVGMIRSAPDTPRQFTMEPQAVAEIRNRVERHIKNTYLKSVQAPIGVKPGLKAWMELS
jgi:superfamily II DNA or RNA helicase